MEFGPIHSCSSSSSSTFAVAMLLVTCGAHAFLSLLVCLDWSEMARGEKIPSGASPRRRLSLVVVVALALAIYHLVGRFWDLSFFFPNSPGETIWLLGEISAPEWVTAPLVVAIVLLAVAACEPFRRQWPASSPYASAAEAATRPLRLLVG